MASNVDDSDSESSSDSDTEVPDAAVCEKLCQEFASITCSDSAMAMMCLQKSRWDLEKALEKYFQTQGSDSLDPAVLAAMKESDSQAFGTDSTSTRKAEEKSALNNMVAKDDNPFRIRILSWNIDGLDLNNIQTRTSAACKQMLEINPDIVFLQEVVPKTLQTITNLMNKSFLCISAGEQGYFTMMLLNRSTVMHESHQVIPFYSSQMGRNILECEANIKGIPFYMMTSHLESTASASTERLKQFKKCLMLVSSSAKNRVAVFGGDLNIRDKEVATVSIPGDIVDVWEFCGKRKDAQYTWDTMRNDNLGLDGKFKSRLRFDRLFYRPDEKKSVKPVYFELVGLERLAQCRRFVSDHWGILSHYNIIA